MLLTRAIMRKKKISMKKVIELSNYKFVIPKLLAGSGHLNKCGKIDSDLFKFLRKDNIYGVVNLTEWTYESKELECLKDEDFVYTHIPIEDFCIPTLEQCLDFFKFVNSLNKEEKGVLVHCAGGYGRTGTMLAAYFLHLGKEKDADEAISTIRKMREGSIETEEQEEFLRKHCQDFS